MTGGTIQLRAKVGNEDYADLGDPYTITGNENGSVTISNTATDLEAISGGVADAEEVTFTAIITDSGSTSTTGTESGTTLTFDQTVPVISAIATSWGDVLNGTEANEAGSVTITTTGVEDNQELTFTINDVTYASNSITSNSTGAVAITAEQLQGMDNGTTETIVANVSDAAGNPAVEVSSTFTVDTTAPGAFTVGAVVTTGGTVVASKWNSTNTGVDITVPVATDDASLTGGTIQLRAKVGNEDYADLGDPYTITGNENGSVTISNTATDLEAISDGVADAEEVIFTAIITDSGSTSTTGTQSNTTLTFDQTAPTAAITYSTTSPYNNTETVTITATFNEAMADDPVVKIALSGAATLTATEMSKVSATSYTYSYAVPTANGTQTVALSVGTDVAGNAITSEPTDGKTFVIDSTAPGAFTV